MHACAVKGCDRRDVPVDRLMCRRHWHHVPFSLGSKVIDTWLALKRARRSKVASEQLAALRRYVKAKDEAIAFVEQLERGK